MSHASSVANKLIEAEDYARTYLVDMAFEEHLITARQDHCLEFLGACQPKSVLEVGCGPALLIDRFDLAGSAITQWMVVEPSFYADSIAERMAGCDKIGLSRGYLEERIDVLREACPDGYDAVMLSGLLHETANPAVMLDAAFTLLRPGGHVFVSVPNAHSFHRLLGVEMGMIEAPTELSERNVALGQPVVFHRQSLEALVEASGFANSRFSGYMFKPFSNGQMGSVIETIGSHVVEGLNRLGSRFPEQAAEIAVVARKPD
ncbi:class I SAM-dependent methyltransferase [Erythrobacter sp. WG]|uniref:class I SAM-dependent methyltransferase n=1 Tax=Erythrobacter sp. WG TaxID=2985510 RepID=UPI00226D936B|nr:class I SAM-dependent methyltransferase [Erythrobacter sp. WG]MCX9148589.1 class I SAM-dependent methyltransferase [Erythrobacter sp. WG]